MPGDKGPGGPASIPLDGRRLLAAVAAHYEDVGHPLRSIVFEPIPGSGFHQTHRLSGVDAESGCRVTLFTKSGSLVPSDFFVAEAAGLSALAAVGILRVPGQVWSGRVGGYAFLVMEAVENRAPGPSFFREFGRQLAEHHQKSRGSDFGFDTDNYLGTTPQPNRWNSDWVDFFRRQRLGYQLQLVRGSGRSTPELDRLGDRLLDRLGEWLDLPEEPACLLHGDLWSGNFLVDGEERAVVIDPAAHFGHRECDLAMTQLFGGFAPAFYDAYREFWPLPPGSDERLAIYQLYHQVNHFNLFGGGYLAGCLATLRRLVG